MNDSTLRLAGIDLRGQPSHDRAVTEPLDPKAVRPIREVLYDPLEARRWARWRGLIGPGGADQVIPTEVMAEFLRENPTGRYRTSIVAARWAREVGLEVSGKGKRRRRADAWCEEFGDRG